MEVKSITYLTPDLLPVRTKISKVSEQVQKAMLEATKAPKGKSTVITLEGKSTQTFMTKLREACDKEGYECYRVKQQVVITQKGKQNAKAPSK